MAHTINDFLEYYPEFSDVSDQTIIDRFLNETDLMVSLGACPRIAPLIRYAYAAHMLTKSSSAPGGMDDGVGVVTTKTVGSVSETRQSTASKFRSHDDDFYGSTMYGKRFLQLRAVCRPAVVVAP